MAEKTVALPRLSDAVARKLQPLPGDKRTFYREAGNKNLMLSVSFTGNKPWLYVYKPEGVKTPRRDIIGYFPDMSYTQAVAKAAEITLGRRQDGLDPRRDVAVPRRGTEAVTVDDLIEAYRKFLANKKPLKPRTLRNFDDQTREFREHFGPRNYRRAVTPVSLGDWFLTHRPHNRSAQMTAQWMRAAHNHGRKRTVGLLPPGLLNPFTILIAETPRLRDPGGTHCRALEDDEMVRLLDAFERAKAIARGEREPEPGIPRISMQAILAVELIMYTGMRKEEARCLDQDEIRGDLIVLPEHKTSTQDGDKEIPLSADALRVLEEARVLRAQIGYPGKAVFPPACPSNRHGYVSALRNAAMRLGKMADLGPILKCHGIRSIYINYQRVNGVDIVQIGKLVGHKRPDTTRKHYVKTLPSERRASVKAAEGYIGRMRALAGGKATGKPRKFRLRLAPAAE